MNRVIETFEKGNVYTQQNERSNRDTPWTPHAKFSGVSMKTLVREQDSGGSFSTHLVRVESGCEIGAHVHETQTELHEVLDGQGRCIIDGREIAYAPGTSTVISAGILHSVSAGKEDLVLKATFVPALA